MAYTFLKAEGVEVGKSRVEEDKLSLASRLLESAKRLGVDLVLPIDHVCGTSPDEHSKAIDVTERAIPKDLMGLDIGGKTRALYTQHLRDAKTILWNGPMGLFEVNKFATGNEFVTTCSGRPTRS